MGKRTKIDNEKVKYIRVSVNLQPEDYQKLNQLSTAEFRSITSHASWLLAQVIRGNFMWMPVDDPMRRKMKV